MAPLLYTLQLRSEAVVRLVIFWLSFSSAFSAPFDRIFDALEEYCGVWQLNIDLFINIDAVNDGKD